VGEAPQGSTPDFVCVPVQVASAVMRALAIDHDSVPSPCSRKAGRRRASAGVKKVKEGHYRRGLLTSEAENASFWSSPLYMDTGPRINLGQNASISIRAEGAHVEGWQRGQRSSSSSPYRPMTQKSSSDGCASGIPEIFFSYNQGFTVIQRFRYT
jgi:hypothetical protein